MYLVTLILIMCHNLIDETLIETWQKNFSKDELIHFAASGGFRHEDWEI